MFLKRSRICALLIAFSFSFALSVADQAFGAQDAAEALAADTPEIDYRAEAMEMLEALRARDFDTLKSKIATETMPANVDEQFEAMRAQLPDEDPKSVNVVSENTTWASSLAGNGTSTTTELLVESEFSQSWLLSRFVFVERGGRATVTTFRIEPRRESLATTNAFTFEGKGFAHYAVVALAVVLPIFSLSVLVIAARTKPLNKKWRWIVFILFGLGQVSFNWTTGLATFKLLSIQLLSAGFSYAHASAPVEIGISLPVGAIVFLWWRRRNAYAVDSPQSAPAS